MKIGFVFEGSWLGAKDGYYVKVLELYNSLKKHNEVIVTSCNLPNAHIGYKTKKDFIKFANKIDAIIIIAGNLYTDKFTLINIFRKRKIPVIWILEAPAEEISLLPWAKNRSVFINKLRMKFLSRHVDLCLCVSKEIEKYAKNDLGIVNTLVMPNGSNPILFKKTNKGKNVLGKIRKVYKVVWAGAGQYPWQGLDIIVSVAKKMSQQKDIVFIIITNQSWIKIPSSLNNLLILSAVEYETLPDYLNEADLFLCLYKKNFRNNLYNSPMKLFDFMAMEKPIIASNIGQIGEIIDDGRNGILTNNKVVDISKKILLLKSNKKISSAISRNARNDISKIYNWEKVVQNIEREIKLLKI